MEGAKRVSTPPVIHDTINAPSGNPITNAAAIPGGAPLSAMPVARAASPLTPAIRPSPSSIKAAAQPIIRPPMKPSKGMAWGNKDIITHRSTEV